MNRTIKDATVKRFHYASHDQLRQHLADFVAAYNFGRRLKTPRGLTPYEFICQCWTKEPGTFTLNPPHQTPGLNIWAGRRFGRSRLLKHNSGPNDILPKPSWITTPFNLPGEQR